jgi:hypothetical protein
LVIQGKLEEDGDIFGLLLLAAGGGHGGGQPPPAIGFTPHPPKSPMESMVGWAAFLPKILHGSLFEPFLSSLFYPARYEQSFMSFGSNVPWCQLDKN